VETVVSELDAGRESSSWWIIETGAGRTRLVGGTSCSSGADTGGATGKEVLEVDWLMMFCRGNVFSPNVTYHEIYNLCVGKWKQRYALCVLE
jgi:hypothetical protein